MPTAPHCDVSTGSTDPSGTVRTTSRVAEPVVDAGGAAAAASSGSPGILTIS